MKRFAPFLIALCLGGCTHDFFFPTRILYRRPEELGIKTEWLKFPSQDGVKITGLLMKTSQASARGIVVQFHGNGENMTSHFGFSYWLPAQGYDVFIFDYRGYGASAGKPSVKGAVDDGIAAMQYILNRNDLPRSMIIWGQSLGGALSIASLCRGKFESNPRIRALILESSFDSYEDMAEEVLSRSWLTWPLQWPLSRLLISDRYAPQRLMKILPRIPILVIHGDQDKIVPFSFGERLFAELPQPKTFWRVKGGGHLEAFTRFGADFKPRLVQFLNTALHVKESP
jgi:hypothetical protein